MAPVVPVVPVVQSSGVPPHAGAGARPATVACRSYATHQSFHRRTSEGWVCDACTEES